MSTIGFGCAAEGDILWDYDTNERVDTILVDTNGYIYVAENDETISKLNPDGTLIDGMVITLTTSATTYNGNVMALSRNEDALFVYDEETEILYSYDTTDFSENWNVAISDAEDEAFTEFLVDDNGYLYYTQYFGMLKINPDNGAIVWEINYDDFARSTYYICGTPAISPDGETIAILSESIYADEHLYVDFFDTYSGALKDTTYNAENTDIGFIETSSPCDFPTLFYDGDGNLYLSMKMADGTDSFLVMIHPDGTHEKIGTSTGDISYLRNTPTTNSLGNIVATCKAYNGEDLVRIYDGTTHEKLFGLKATDIPDVASDVAVISTYIHIDENDIAYIVFSGDDGELPSTSGVVALDTVNYEIEWFDNFKISETNYNSYAIRTTPTPCVLVGHGTGVKAIETSAGSLWTFDDFVNEDIGLNFNLMTAQNIHSMIEEEPEEDDNTNYAAWLAWKLSQEKEVVEEIVIEEVVEEEDDEGITSVMFEQNVKDGFPYWIFLILAILIFGYGGKKYMEKK